LFDIVDLEGIRGRRVWLFGWTGPGDWHWDLLVDRVLDGSGCRLLPVLLALAGGMAGMTTWISRVLT
jgi:hypothetical protein